MSQPPVTIALKIDQATLDRVNAAAGARGRSAWIRDAITARLATDAPPEAPRRRPYLRWAPFLDALDLPSMTVTEVARHANRSRGEVVTALRRHGVLDQCRPEPDARTR